MARANLNVSSQLEQAFQNAQANTSKVRAIKATIKNEEIGLTSSVNISGTAENDFNRDLSGILSESEAAMVIFRLSDTAADKTKKWLLIAWVPDGARVRDKMLYSSSRDDLKKFLGLSQFTSDYAASLMSDITWDGYMASTQVNLDQNEILTEKERAKLEEAAQEHVERNNLGSKSAGMGVVPFTLGEGVKEAFKKFNSGTCNWIEMSVVSEVIRLEASKTVDVKNGLDSHIHPTAARFILAKFSNFEKKTLNFFIYSCPENIPIREKMTMSTSKATVTGSASDNGINFDKTIEIHGADEINYQVKAELDPPVEHMSSASATISHAKPARPGKGKTVVKKFQADA